jgi:uncharacterized protein (DUF885 family)
MTRFSHAAALCLAFLGLAGCGAKPAPAPSTAANPNVPHERLSRIVDRYWEEHAAAGDFLSAQFLADSLALKRRFLAEVLGIPRDSLDADSRLTYDIFTRQLELDIEDLTYPSELLPIDPFDGPPLRFARAAADAGGHPFTNAGDYDNWLLRIDDNAHWAREAIANLREGMRRGYTAPRVLVERMLPLLQELGEDRSSNVFYSPLRTLPPAVAEPGRTRLRGALEHAIKENLLPAYRELHDFIQSDYLPRARPSLALSALPLGTPWYAALVKRATDGSLRPNEIHAIGTAEVERLRARLQSLPAALPRARSDVPAMGSDAPAIGSGAPAMAPGDLLAAYQELKVQTLAALPALFAAAPPADFEFRLLNSGGDAAPALRYTRAAPGGGAPAILYVDGAAPPGAAAVDVPGFLRQALPGRHLQSALQQERADLPKFRRFGADAAFQDGWALYAASLGGELGLYHDDEARRGAVSADLICAAALVVDTGLQAQGWTQRQAVDYLRAQLAVNDTEAALMTDRLLAAPAAALACKIGELKFQALRSEAQKALGARFDIREFHAEILKDGAMPLDILEAKIRLWMQTH